LYNKWLGIAQPKMVKQSVSFQTDIRAGNTSIFEKSGEDER
jgi:hypothetical protein